MPYVYISTDITRKTLITYEPPSTTWGDNVAQSAVRNFLHLQMSNWEDCIPYSHSADTTGNYFKFTYARIHLNFCNLQGFNVAGCVCEFGGRNRIIFTSSKCRSGLSFMKLALLEHMSNRPFRPVGWDATSQLKSVPEDSRQRKHYKSLENLLELFMVVGFAEGSPSGKWGCSQDCLFGGFHHNKVGRLVGWLLTGVERITINRHRILSSRKAEIDIRLILIRTHPFQDRPNWNLSLIRKSIVDRSLLLPFAI